MLFHCWLGTNKYQLGYKCFPRNILNIFDQLWQKQLPEVFYKNLSKFTGKHLLPLALDTQFLLPRLNPFVPNAPFLYPLKISEIRKVFWCFQGVEKGCINSFGSFNEKSSKEEVKNGCLKQPWISTRFRKYSKLQWNIKSGG